MVDFKQAPSRVKLVVTLGATLNVDQVDWVKPSVSATFYFDGMPSDKDLKEGWRRLWEDQVGPQADEFFEFMAERRRMFPVEQKTNDKPVKVLDGKPVPEGGNYE